MLKFTVIITSVFICTLATAAEDEAMVNIINHRFEPSEINVPAGKRVRLHIENQDTTPEEFESHELNREKLVPAKGHVIIYIGPLSAGRYPFFGEFNPATAQGAVVAK